MIALILVSIIATDIAVAAMFLLYRRSVGAPALMTETVASAEMHDLVLELRAQAEQAGAELSRQKAHLRQVLAEAQRRASVEAPIAETRQGLLRMASDGFSPRAMASRTGMSLEEVRLTLAMSDEAPVSA